jgi:hypothetical protein
MINMKNVRFSGMIGDHISDFANRLVEIRKNKNHDIEGEFNEVVMKVTTQTTVEEILKDYDNQCEQRREAWVNSPEYKERERKREEEVKKMSIEAQHHVESINSLDFSDLNCVLEWLVKLQPLSDRIGVLFDREAVINGFEQHGYEANMNTKENFNEEDKGNFAGYIIGQCLSGLNSIGSIHHMAVIFTERWKNKFAC